MIFITGASPGTSELRADSSRLRRRSQRVEPGSGQRWRHGEHATTCCGGGPLSERIDDHTMPTYYLILCSGYIRLLYRLYKLIIIIIIYYNIYIYYTYLLPATRHTYPIKHPKFSMVGTAVSTQAGGAPVFARPRTLVKAGRLDSLKTPGTGGLVVWNCRNPDTWQFFD